MRTACCLWLAAACGIGLAESSEKEGAAKPGVLDVAKPMEQCQAEATSAYGRGAVDATPSDSVRPRNTRRVNPSTSAKGSWTGIALLGPDGSVRDVWPVQSIDEKADKAVAKAVRKWQYQPVVQDGQPVPVCMLVSINLR